LYNLSCWEANTTLLLEYGALEAIAEVLSIADLLSANALSMAELLEASSYFDPLAIATLANLCRRGTCSQYSFPRWQKVIGLAIEAFKKLITSKQLQLSPPTNICYAFCSINNWDLARSLIALFVNCLTVEPFVSKKFRDTWVTPETVDFLLQYSRIVDSEGKILLSLLFCLIVDGGASYVPTSENQDMMLDFIEVSTDTMKSAFPMRFCSYTWRNVSPLPSMVHSKHLVVQKWCITFLEVGSKTNIKIYRAPRRPLVDASDDRACDSKRKRAASSNLLELEQPLQTTTRKEKSMRTRQGDVVF